MALRGLWFLLLSLVFVLEKIFINALAGPGIAVFSIINLLFVFITAIIGTITVLVVNIIISLAFAILAFFIAKGLWHGEKWARIIALIFAILGLFWGLVWGVGSPIKIGKITGFISLITSGFIAGYLLFNKKAKEFFKE